MASENIIQPNIPNAITITIMAILGGMAVAAIRKFVGARRGGGSVTTGGAFSN